MRTWPKKSVGSTPFVSQFEFKYVSIYKKKATHWIAFNFYFPQ
ncbi:hypothetical protein IWQ54_006647 [Labrenzia sp. EL_195]|nr:hypothetical protein [Labrenzia sp. EL_195]